MSTDAQRPGSHVVLASYVTMVVLAAVLGFLLGAAILPARIQGPLPMAELGPIQFPITPLNMAVYGASVVAVGFGGAILLVRYASQRAERTAN